MSLSKSDTGNEAARMGFVAVSDGMGGKRLEFRPLPAAPKGKGKKERRAPDPITANPEKSGMDLKLLIERIEGIEGEITGLMDDKKDVYSEAKARGYDSKIIRKIVELRRLDSSDRQEMQAILDTYLSALGIDQ